jgi:alpha-tubulin suppressor-like RCC1 family protein
LWCWGIHLTGKAERQLTHILPGQQFSHVTVGGWQSHACAVTTSAETLCWGRNVQGSLGDGSGTSERLAPARVAGGHSFVQVETFSWTTCGLTGAGKLFCWGALPLGSGPITRSHYPVEVSSGVTFQTISVGIDFYCGITRPGHLYCGGNWPSLGNGTGEPSSVATRVLDPLYMK